MVEVIGRVADQVFIPLTVGGGVRQVDVRKLLNAGADKVSINTSAVENPDLGKRRSALRLAGDRGRDRCARRRPWPLGGFLHARRAKARGLDAERAATWPSAARAKHCPPAWTAMAPRAASTSSSRAVSTNGAGDPPAAAWARSSILPKASSGAGPTRCSPHRCSISARSPYPTRSASSPRAESRCACERLDRQRGMELRWPRAAVAQDAASGEVLTLAWMNRESLRRTAESGEAHLTGRVRARHSGRRARPPATCSAWSRSGSIATRTRCCCASSRSPVSLAHTGRRRCFFTAPGGRGRRASLGGNRYRARRPGELPRWLRKACSKGSKRGRPPRAARS